jgi:hypothetical protein
LEDASATDTDASTELAVDASADAPVLGTDAPVVEPDAASAQPDSPTPEPDTSPPPEPDVAPPPPDTPPLSPDTAPDTAKLDMAPVPDASAPDLTPDMTPDMTPDVTLPPPVFPPVVISEIMYHPVQENAFDDNHEFIELHNRTAATISLAGWTLAGQVTFTFPAGATISPHGYLVVARNKIALAAVTTYGLDVADVIGDYTGNLDNGGGNLALFDHQGTSIDVITYDDAFPWPIGADALGAQSAWLRASDLPLSAHQYKGRSLERYSFDKPGTDVENWAPSPLDGATPGRANNVSGTPPAIVEALSATSRQSPTGLIRSSHQVVIKATFSAGGTVKSARVEYFVDKVAETGEARSTSNMSLSSGAYQTTLASRADNSIVRYRILADRGSGMEVVSPRPSDPFEWHAYFVSPSITNASHVYQMHISPESWGRLWTNINFPTAERRVVGCAMRDTWDDRVPAVFVHEGRVHDVFVRYQGSRWNRPSGATIATWTAPGPTAGPSPLKALSWNISFPKYNQLDKRGRLTLSKLGQSCPGLNSTLAASLYAAVGVPVSQVAFARLYINGAYYHYMMNVEHPDEDMMKRYVPGGARMGDLFKSSGCSCDEGPWGWGDERPLDPFCGHAPDERYKRTYDRQTNDWRDNTDLKKLIQDLTAARASGAVAMRAFFDANFDVDLLTNYYAIRNWSAPWDDFFHNHMLYRRDDGKWLLLPWDVDKEFGQSTSSQAAKSFFVGQQGNTSNRSGYWNRLKDAFLHPGVYRTEFEQKLVSLAKTLLSPANVKAMVDQATTQFSQSDAKAAPAGIACDPAFVTTTVKNFADARHANLMGGIK